MVRTTEELLLRIPSWGRWSCCVVVCIALLFLEPRWSLLWDNGWRLELSVVKAGDLSVPADLENYFAYILVSSDLKGHETD